MLSAAPARDRPIAGVGFMLAFAAVAPLLDMFAKFASAELAAAQIGLVRFVVQASLLAGLAAAAGRLRAPPPGSWPGHMRRGALVGAATTFFFTAVAVMPLADAMAAFFVMPLILTALSGTVLGERVGWRRFAACGVGMLGAVVIVQPGVAAFGWAAAAPLAAACCFAGYLAMTRADSARETPLDMQLWSSVAGAAVLAAALAVGAATGWDPFSLRGFSSFTAWMLLGMGACSTLAHLAITNAFARAPAATLAPLQYLEIVTATIAGWLAFGDWPQGPVWAGMTLIVGAGLFVIWRERLAAR